MGSASWREPVIRHEFVCERTVGTWRTRQLRKRNTAWKAANWRPFHDLKHEGIEILRYFPENTRHVLSIVCLYRRCQQKSRPGTHSSSRQLNPFFFSLLSLPGGFLSTGVSFCPQRVDSSSQWENPPAGSSLKVQKPPLTGTITPLASRPTSQSFQ